MVERYFGRDVARNTSWTLEYQGLGWLDPKSNNAYAKRPRGTKAHPVCVVCVMHVDRASATSSVYHQRTYCFCMEVHKESSDARPAQFLS